MSYNEAMEAAGAKVLAYESFGSYQGDWWAKVEFNGKQYWVHGWYGSCSGCDAFVAHFGYSEGETCDEHRYEYPRPEDCKECDAAKVVYQKKLAEFGESYLLGNEFTQEEAEKETGPDENRYRDEENARAHEFIKANPLPVEVN